jgi:hypothetical protein
MTKSKNSLDNFQNFPIENQNILCIEISKTHNSQINVCD